MKPAFSSSPMKWKKRGVLIQPDPQHEWCATHAGPSFVDTLRGDPKILVTGRDSTNCSHIGEFELSVSNESLTVNLSSGRTLLSPGDLGTFDESGVSYPWLVHHNGTIFMYYVGWVAGGKTRFQNYTGLAMSDDNGNTFHRCSNVPILDRVPEEPFGSGSCAVWFNATSGWKMIYTSFEPWTVENGMAKPCYRLKEAISDNGVEWHRTGRVVIDFENPGEHIVGKPMIIHEYDTTRLWYSYRGDSYRIGYAECADGDRFIRMDSKVGIDVSESGWDSKMIEYAYVFDFEGSRFMVYNGNEFGKTGLGYAVLEV
jgi:hypothetical protein